jgi:hypothetical protein
MECTAPLASPKRETRLDGAKAMKVAVALIFMLIPVNVYAQESPFAPRLDQLPARPGQPICDDWYANVALPQYGCHADTIRKICSGQLPKVHSGPYCGNLEQPPDNTGKTCQTLVGQCPLAAPAPLNAGCYCHDAAQHSFNGRVIQP